MRERPRAWRAGSRALRPVLVAVGLLAACGSAGATPLPQGPGSATVSVSSTRPGARPVVLTLVLTYEMQCGYPGPGPIVIDLRQLRLPGRLARSQVLVAGHPARSVAVAGSTVTVGLAPRPEILCTAIAPGRLAIVFTRAAGLGNPLRAGKYAITATRGGSTMSAYLTIRAGGTGSG